MQKLVCLFLQLAQSEAEHAGLRGAVVAAMRHIIGQQKALRHNIAQLSSVLAVGLLVPDGEDGTLSEDAKQERMFREQVALQLSRLAKVPPPDGGRRSPAGGPPRARA
jgi:hypothetical protein